MVSARGDGNDTIRFSGRSKAFVVADQPFEFNVRVEQDRLCCLVFVGVRLDGTKELVAPADGYRESTDPGGDLLRHLERRGMPAPMLAVGDGALGFWAALAGCVARNPLAAGLGPQGRQRVGWSRSGVARLTARLDGHHLRGVETEPNADHRKAAGLKSFDSRHSATPAERLVNQVAQVD